MDNTASMDDNASTGNTADTILVIGGGLSGLHTAYSLWALGRDVRLIEGRDRLGGRILSAPVDGDDPAAGAYDLGPAWFWPGQRRMQALIEELGLASDVVGQYARGDELVERGPGAVQRGRFGVSMGGAFRLRRGVGSVIDALAAPLPDGVVHLGRRATRVVRTPAGVRVETGRADGGGATSGTVTFDGARVAVALPPRVALSTLELGPALDAARRAELAALPTWMAGQGKCVAVYDAPFWRRNGLSGDAVSTVGPLGEIHDVTPGDGGPGVLFGFFALPPASRRAAPGVLERACARQLARLFGDVEPRQIVCKDWAFDPLTATDDDRTGPAAHAWTGLRTPREPAWGGRLLWSGSETAGVGERHNGYLEGALEASERTVELLIRD
ncbi:MAG: FAD-dependent oxidoreductase [Acidobacteriota bacterium]